MCVLYVISLADSNSKMLSVLDDEGHFTCNIKLLLCDRLVRWQDQNVPYCHRYEQNVFCIHFLPYAHDALCELWAQLLVCAVTEPEL